MTNNTPNIKILVAYHKPAPIIDNDLFIAVNGGRALLEEKHNNHEIDENSYQWLIKNTIGDNTGENISAQNNQYNELSILYWAWKNYDKIGNPEYIGLSHYRRSFIFSDFQKSENSVWTINFPAFNSKYVESLHLENINKYIKENDCLYACCETPHMTVYEQYKIAPRHYIQDLDFVLQYIGQKYPEYEKSAQKYVNGNKNYFCNMFILKKEYFFQYCHFIFDVLQQFLNHKDYSESSHDEKRFYISERITGIFIQYLIDQNVASSPLNISLLENTNIDEEIYPWKSENNIPIVFAFDEKYASTFSVALESLIANSSSKYHYDIVALNSDITTQTKNKLISQCRKKDNINLRFVDITPYLSEINQKELYIEIHVSIATYYRFFIADIFKNYKKILYLDCDIVINKDIAELYNFDLNDAWLGAAIDIRESIPVKLSMNVSNRNWRDYVINTLGLKDPYKYFQAGVLLFDVSKLIKYKLKEKCFLKLHEIKNPILSDQDVLNAVFYDHVNFFPTNWNIEWQIPFEFPEYAKIIKADLFDTYEKALKNPYIIHYASSKKPINYPHGLSYYWFSYARNTPFYEDIFLNYLLNLDYLSKKTDRLLRLDYIFSKFYYLKYKILNKLAYGKKRKSLKEKARKYKMEKKLIQRELRK